MPPTLKTCTEPRVSVATSFQWKIVIYVVLWLWGVGCSLRHLLIAVFKKIPCFEQCPSVSSAHVLHSMQFLLVCEWFSWRSQEPGCRQRVEHCVSCTVSCANKPAAGEEMAPFPASYFHPNQSLNFRSPHFTSCFSWCGQGRHGNSVTTSIHDPKYLSIYIQHKMGSLVWFYFYLMFIMGFAC